MLLGPECFEQLGDPAVDRSEPMEPGVAGAAEGDQRRGAVRGPAVVDDERRGGLADAAEVMVAGQDPFPAPAEAGPRAPAAVVAGLAQSAAVEIPRTAGAAQRQLDLACGGHGERVFLKRPQALRRVGAALVHTTDKALLRV